MSTSTVNIFPATITSGNTDSSAVDVAENGVCGLEIPSAFTGSSISFKVTSNPNGTYQTLTNSDGTTYTLTVAAGKNIIVRPINLAGWRFMKLVSGSTESADRKINIMARHVD